MKLSSRRDVLNALAVGGIAAGVAASRLGVGAALAESATGVAAASVPPGGPVNVRAFGALGDGHTDDTAAFLNALDVLNREQATRLVIPWGKYRLTRSLVLTGGSCIIEGDNSWLDFGAGDYRSVKLGDGRIVRPCLHVAQRNCRVSGVKLFAKATNADCGLLGFVDTSAKGKDKTWGRIVLDNIEINGQPGAGLVLEGAEHAHLSQIWIGTSGATGLHLYDCSWALIENCRSFQNGGSGTLFEKCLYLTAINLQGFGNAGFQIAVDHSRGVRLVEPDSEQNIARRPKLRAMLVNHSYNTQIIGGHTSHMGTALLVCDSTRTSYTWPVIIENKIADAFLERPSSEETIRDAAAFGALAKDGALMAFLRRALPISNGPHPPAVICDRRSNGTLDIHIDSAYLARMAQERVVL